MNKPALLVRTFAALTLAVVGYCSAQSYTYRFPDHRGFYLIEASDQVTVKPKTAPRHVVLVVADGLRRDFALELQSIKSIQEKGLCLTMDTSPKTVSRPVYTALSAGVEPDRSGVRNNDEPYPAPVESIFAVAKQNQRSVAAYSEVDWWEVLFPKSFDEYTIRSSKENLFPFVSLKDLVLIHPGYIDEHGHAYGAASKEYKEATERLDQELLAFLPKLDLTQDLLIFTSDHGHTDQGGHGGLQPEVKDVLTCYIGAGVGKEPPREPLSIRMIAPSIALFMGLPLPAHARVDPKEAEFLLSLLSKEAYGEGYLSSRKESLDKRTKHQAEVLSSWLGGTGGWPELYQRERLWQYGKLSLGFVLTAFALYLLNRRRSAKDLGVGLGWSALVVLSAGLLYVTLRGGFDLTSVNDRLTFVMAMLWCGVPTGLLGAVGHYAWRRELSSLIADATVLVVLLLGIFGAHALAFGWRFGFPMPPQFWFFYPFFGASLLFLQSLLLFVLCGLGFWLGTKKN